MHNVIPDERVRGWTNAMLCCKEHGCRIMMELVCARNRNMIMNLCRGCAFFYWICLYLCVYVG